MYFHIDVNSAFLSWEAAERLRNGEQVDLRDIPSIVGGSIEKRRGVVLAKSIPAKAYGIKTGEPVVDAVRKCPNLKVVPSNFDLYMKSSRAMFDLFRKYTNRITIYSIDECFIDIRDLDYLYPDHVALAYEIKEEIKKQLGFTVSVGVSDQMLLAKMASDMKKPDAVTVLYQSDIEDKMWGLPIEDLFMVGRQTSKRLRKIGIATIGDLARAKPDFIENYLGAIGKTAWYYANGQEEKPLVEKRERSKSIGNSNTLIHDVNIRSEALIEILSLTEKVMARLRKEKMLAKTIAVEYKNSDFETFAHQVSLSNPTDATMKAFEEAEKLFDELWRGDAIRAIGLRVSNLISVQNEQVTLFESELERKQRKVDFVVDEIKKDVRITRSVLL